MENTLENFIRNSEPARANKFTEHEVDQMAGAVRGFLRTQETSVEGLFDIDNDEYIGVVLISDV